MNMDDQLYYAVSITIYRSDLEQLHLYELINFNLLQLTGVNHEIPTICSMHTYRVQPADIDEKYLGMIYVHAKCIL